LLTLARFVRENPGKLMLRAAIASWFQPAPHDSAPSEGRPAYHSDIRALRPDAFRAEAPVARGRDVEQAMWLAGVSSRDFAQVVDLALSPQLVTPVDDVIELCARRSMACKKRADMLAAELPPPNSYGRPPLPWHRRDAREARDLHRAAQAWDTLGRLLLSNRWQS
jgi:hypothetical protein